MPITEVTPQIPTGAPLEADHSEKSAEETFLDMPREAAPETIAFNDVMKLLHEAIRLAKKAINLSVVGSPKRQAHLMHKLPRR